MDAETLAAVPTEQMLPWLMMGLFWYGLCELAFVHFRLKRARLGEYGMAFKGLGFNILIGIAITALAGPLNKTLLAIWGASLSPFNAGLGPIGWIYGFLVYELMYWFQHWLAHKVRLLWCLHSPHHAPGAMHMFVGFNHSFLESILYMPFMLGFLTGLLGVHPVVVVVITFVDIMWGNFLHVSDNVVTRRLGPLEYFMQTPSYHRVHHAQNVRYMDTNYNSITLLGDWLMRTLQPLDDAEPVRYGITRDVNTSSFFDVHFGEFVLLGRDLAKSRSAREFFGYLLRAPGWQPHGEQQTAAARKLRELAAPTADAA
ncbi:MAG: sterol desaturase family protein [Halioglobus sp.]|nr:sterol desaturase family protein [Halioglobus sp.]